MRRIRPRSVFDVLALVSFFLVVGGGTAIASYVVSSNGQIAPNTISGHQPPSGDHANIVGGSVNAQDLAAAAVTGGKVASSAITGAKIQDRSVGRADLSTAAQGARAYAEVPAGGAGCSSPVQHCAVVRSKRVAYAVLVGTGKFCVGVDGISADDPHTIALVAPTDPRGHEWARWLGADGDNVDCVASEFEVQTGSGPGTPGAFSFTITIP
jgi:hypothetical protein